MVVPQRQGCGRQVVDDRIAEVSGQQKPRHDPRTNQHNRSMSITGLRECENDTSKQEHRPQRPTKHSHPRQHAKGRTCVVWVWVWLWVWVWVWVWR